jgi:transcriptional regulator GlxA family with amidase domain
MRETNLTGEQLAARFTAAGDTAEAMIQAAIGVVLDVERRLGPQEAELVVPFVIRALRRHRREQFRSRPEATPPFPALQPAIAAAERDLFRRLRRSPTVDEVASHLGLAEHQVIAGLEAGWSAGPARIGTR